MSKKNATRLPLHMLMSLANAVCDRYGFKRIDWLIEHQGMTHEEAIEWIEYNTIRALPYAGEGAPVVYYPLE